MTSPTSGDLTGVEFVGADLRRARFVRSDLSDVVMRAVDIGGADIDAPWLIESGAHLTVNGVDVAGFVDEQLNLRFAGRALRLAVDPAGLTEAWQAIRTAWDAAMSRASAMPDGTVDVSVAGEWSFAQTLRHLVMAIDTWLRKAVLHIEDPYHPIGMPNAEYATDGYDLAVFAIDDPSFAEVLEVLHARWQMVSEFLASVTPEVLAEERPNPWGPDHTESVLACLHTIFEESWEHLRFATRDLDIIERAGQVARGWGTS